MLCFTGMLFFGGVKATIVAKGILRFKQNKDKNVHKNVSKGCN